MAYPRNIDTWNPMAESYHDANINSYEHGPGVNLTPYVRPSPDAEHKLYVSNLPLELTETGLRQLFDRHGKTTGVISPPDTTWGFVTYATFREAEAAIRALNETSPLNLRVSFAKQSEKQSNRRKPTVCGIPNIEALPYPPILDNPCREYISPEQRPQITRPIVRNSGRGKELAILARRMTAPPGHMYHETDDLLYPDIHDPNIYDPYEDAEPFPEINDMWTRPRIKVSNDGTRFVTMGRGYTWYKLPAPHPKVNEQIRAVYLNREAGLYEYGDNKFAQQIGPCQHCNRRAVMRCQRCREFYCSKTCQEADWPRHKVECQLHMPGLEGGADSRSFSLSSGEDQPFEEPMKRSIRKMRRPMKSEELQAVPNSTSTPLSVASPVLESPPAHPQGTSEPKGKENAPVLSQDNFKRSRTGDQKRGFDQDKPFHHRGGWTPTQNGNKMDHRPLRNVNNQGERSNENPLNVPSQPPLKQDNQATQEPNRSSPPKNFENKSLQSQNTAGPNQRNYTQQQDGQTNKNFFKRGDRGNFDQRPNRPITEQVKNLNMNDTDNKKPVSAAKPLLPDPDVGFYKATDTPGTSGVRSTKVAFQEPKIDSVPGPSGYQFPSKTVENDTSKKISQTMDPLSAAKCSPEPKQERKNVVELLEANEDGCFEVHVLLGANKAAVTVCVNKIQEEYAKISSELTPECEKLMDALLFQPKVGDFVCGKRRDDWIRGTVVSLTPHMRLAAADEGRVEPVVKFKNIPQGYVNLPTLGAVCELTKGDFKLEPMAQYTFSVVDTVSGEVVIYSSDEKEGRGFLKPWTPAPEQKGVPYASITSGNELYLVSFRSHALICARSLVPKDMELFNKVTQDVARWSAQTKPMTQLPVEGEMVIAKYVEDGNFYRAIVRKINGTKITVSYVDWGNIETTTLENILPVSPKLKEYPSCVAKIILKDVPKDVPMNKEVSQYLADLAGKETPLMCTFEGSPSTDGVILKSADGTSVNNKINELLTPSWKKEEKLEDKTKVYMLADLEVAELGSVGQTISVLALFSYGPLLHAMAPQDQELITHVTGIMAGQIEAYCNQEKNHYIPRQNELCLAPFEGMWYRAVCLEPTATSTSSIINFVDFGNIETIPHTDLRIMIKDFMTTKTLASVCSVVGLGPVDEEGNLPPAIGARVTELIPTNGVVLVKIVECSKPGEYNIELPEIRETLVKEGLLKL